MKKNKYIKKILTYSVILLIFFFIIRYLYINISSVDLSKMQFNFYLLFLSVFIYFLYLFFTAVIWYVITKQNNCAINFFETLKLRIYSSFGKYIPGKVFSYGIMLYNYEQKSISKKKIVICFFQELALSFLAIIIISLFSVFLTDIEKFSQYKIIFLVLAGVCLIFLHPKILQFFITLALKILKKETVKVELPFSRALGILLLFIADFLLFGWAFYFFINSFYPYPVSEYFFTTGAFLIAFLIGVIAVFAPSGLGVREGVLVFTLGYIFPAAIGSLISLASRIWMTLCELLFLAIIVAYNFVDKKIVDKKNTKTQ